MHISSGEKLDLFEISQISIFVSDIFFKHLWKVFLSINLKGSSMKTIRNNMFKSFPTNTEGALLFNQGTRTIWKRETQHGTKF